jgi:hypothetical protein
MNPSKVNFCPENSFHRSVKVLSFHSSLMKSPIDAKNLRTISKASSTMLAKALYSSMIFFWSCDMRIETILLGSAAIYYNKTNRSLKSVVRQLMTVFVASDAWSGSRPKSVLSFVGNS